MTSPPESSTLVALGFDQDRLEEIESLGVSGDCGRVVRVDRSSVSVLTSTGLLRVDTSVSDSLIVGDWVIVNGDSLTALTRRTELVRRIGPRRDERQPMASNIDLVLVVRAMDAQIRLNRLSTLIVIAYDSGATPVVVLTKADLNDDPAAACREVSTGLGGIETLAISTKTGAGLDALRARIVGQTIVLLGESGAGKSTLTNALCGVEQLATAEVRRDGQGRHTTTHRELVLIPSGGVVIDTPGIRDAAAFGDGDGVNLAFADVVELASHCKFSDCSHESTPGCAIAAALAANEIDPARVDAYLFELSEMEWLDRRLDQRAQNDEKRSSRSRSRDR